jgi:hypothetical protein
MARPRVGMEHPQHRARDRDRILLRDAAHRHAKMRRFHHDGDAVRADLVANRLGHLRREALLHLQAAREDVHHTRDFAQADHPPIRQIRHMAPAEEREHVMLAEAIEIDVPDDHHLVILDREQRVVQ